MRITKRFSDKSRPDRRYRFGSIATTLVLIAWLIPLQSTAHEGEQRSSKNNNAKIEALANCFATGIDAIGRSDTDAGRRIWSSCYDDRFSISFTPTLNAFSIDCPGPHCPIQDGIVGAELRTQFADTFFRSLGYVATQHTMTNISVKRQGRRAKLNAYLTATHIRADGSIDLWNGFYTAKTVRRHGRWVIIQEEIEGISYGNIITTPIQFN